MARFPKVSNISTLPRTIKYGRRTYGYMSTDSEADAPKIGRQLRKSGYSIVIKKFFHPRFGKQAAIYVAKGDK